VEILPDGNTGSLSIIGTVSPAGGNFDEPVTQATLLATGAFWGLSRALSDARKYPAIDRLDSNSSYPSLLTNEEVFSLKALLREGKSIASNIILMGEKGITDETYIQFQKAELVDAVFLQQNSFHEVDGVTNPDRLRVMFDMVWKIVQFPVNIKGKDEIRSHFNFLRQAFIDWNTMRPDDNSYEKQKNQLLNLIKLREHAEENL
jgi:V/A-type H+-transporting ATPase subunit A